MSEEERFYVYAHVDADGTAFYVGKGTGRRAWSTDRQKAWHLYVSEHLDDEYEVVILESNLSEDEAVRLEQELIRKHGEHLINWVNPGRRLDYDALEKYHELRDSNRKFVAETKPLEKSEPERAIQRYRKALKRMREYESMQTERGLVAEVMEGSGTGDIQILDRLTLCLKHAGRAHEAVEVADNYFADFPEARDLAIGARIERRVERFRSSD